MKRIDCRKCRYFRVTWEKTFPYACDFFGFKSASPPSATVFSSSGLPCREFSPKRPSNGGGGEDGKGFRV